MKLVGSIGATSKSFWPRGFILGLVGLGLWFFLVFKPPGNNSFMGPTTNDAVIVAHGKGDEKFEVVSSAHYPLSQDNTIGSQSTIQELSEAERAFCILQRAKPDFSFSVVDLFFYQMKNFRNGMGQDQSEWHFAVIGAGCPSERYSIAQVLYSEMAGQGQVLLKKSLSCFEEISPAEQLLLMREQGDVVDEASNSEYKNMAIVGQGYFLLSCGGKKVLSRVGSFALDPNTGFLEYGSNCHLLNQQFHEFHWQEGFTQIARSPCFENSAINECLALIDPVKINLRRAELLEFNMVTLDDVSGLEFALDAESRVFLHSLEKLQFNDRVGGIAKGSFIRLEKDPDCSKLNLQ